MKLPLTCPCLLHCPSRQVSNPTLVRHNTLRHIGPSAGILVGKNCIAELNHIYDHRAIQLDGAMIQGGAHDRFEQGITSQSQAAAEGGSSRYGVAYVPRIKGTYPVQRGT